MIVVSIILIHSLIWGSVMTRGGANLIISPWVGFANNPFFIRLMQMSSASKSEVKKGLNFCSCLKNFQGLTLVDDDRVQ